MSRRSVLVIQYNWDESLRHKERVWAYHKKLNESSTHGYLNDSKFTVVARAGRTITIYCPIASQTVLYAAPAAIFQNIHSKSVVCLATSLTEELGVSISNDCKIVIWDTGSGSIEKTLFSQRTLDGHLFDVYSCQFFPSGIVVLSAGADMKIKIWDALTGECRVTMTGHTAAITDTAIIDKGKNVISVSKDGSVRLWNCAESKCIGELLNVNTQINCCDIITASNDIKLPQCNRELGEFEFSTKDKLLAVGCEDGKVHLVAVFAREVIASHSFNNPVICLCWLSSSLLVIGLENGLIMIIDAKKLADSPKELCHDSASSVQCIASVRSGFIVGRRDGLCQYYKTDGSNPTQLTGPDCDPVYGISNKGDYIFTICRDKLIRKYCIADMDL